jgi:redox-sensing transcriptional repressor
MPDRLPEKTVERLSQYRRILLNYQFLEHAFIYSHNLARIVKTNAANVRRDLMLIGMSGDFHKGYDINELLSKINLALNYERVTPIAFVGMGELGRSVAAHFGQHNPAMQIVATFVFGKPPAEIVDGIPVYNISQLQKVIKETSVELCVVAVPAEFARELTSIMVSSGVTGILNFSPVQLQVPAWVHVEQFDIITKLEKTAYFMKRSQKNG